MVKTVCSLMMIYVGPQSWIQGAFMVPQLKDLTVIIKQSVWIFRINIIVCFEPDDYIAARLMVSECKEQVR